MSRFYTHAKGLFFDYRREAEHFKNEYLNNEDWYIERNWFVKICLCKVLFGTNELYYDGHTYKAIQILGIEVGVGFGYDSRPLNKWKPEEMGFKA
jgi:hypothetical protein